jgi:hypothetical protein
MVDQVEQDAGRQAGGRGMRLLGAVRRPELVAPVVQPLPASLHPARGQRSSASNCLGFLTRDKTSMLAGRG